MNAGEIRVILKAATSDFKSQMEGASRALKNVGREMQAVGTKAAAVGVALGAVAVKFANMADKADKSSVMFGVAFGRMSASAEASVSRMSRALHRNETDMQGIAATYQTMIATMLGGDRAQAAPMALQLTDITEQFTKLGFGAEQVEQIIAGAMMGEITSMRRLGVAADTVAIKAAAMKAGFKSIENMPEAQRALLMFRTIIERTKDQMVAAKAATGSWGDKLQGLYAHLETIGEELGHRLMPFLEEVVKGIEKMLDRFDRLSPATKNMALRIGLAVAAIGLLGAALIPLGAIASVLGGLLGGLMSIAAPLLIAAAGAAILVAAFGALKMLWDRDFLGIPDFVKAAIDWFGRFSTFVLGVISSTAEELSKLVDMMKHPMSFRFEDAKKIFAGYDVKMRENARLALSGAPTPEADQAKAAAVDFIATLGTDLKNVISGAISGFKDSFGVGGKALLDLIPEDKRKAFTKALDDLRARIEKLFGTVGSRGGGGVKPATTAAAEDVVTRTIEPLLERMAEVFKEFWKNAPGGLKGALAVGASGFNTGIVGSVVSGATQGAAQGGPGGAIAGAILAFIEKSKGFADLVEKINQVLQPIADSLGAVFQPLMPVIGLFGLILRTSLIPVIEILAASARLVSWVFRELFGTLKAVMVAMLGAVHRALKALGIHIKEVDQALSDWENASIDGLGKLAGAANAAADAMTNIPEGFKNTLAAYEYGVAGNNPPGFGAINVHAGETGGGSGSSGNATDTSAGSHHGAPQSYNTTNNVTITTGDPERIYRELQKIDRRERVRASNAAFPGTILPLGFGR